MFYQLPAIWLVLAVLVVLAVGAYLYKKSKEPKYSDIEIPMPDTKRKDLLYGYYSALERTYVQVKDHVNLFWYTHFSSIEQLIMIAKETNWKIVVDLSPYLHAREDGKKGKLYVKDSAEGDLRDFFARLKFEGVLAHLTYLTTNDEPNVFTRSAEEHLKAINLVKKVCAEFSELKDVKLMVIYAGDGPWINIEQFDVVGCDNYGQKSQSLLDGSHSKLVAALKPGQKTILVPGAGFGQKPDAWLAYAHSHPDEVEAIVPFIWFDDPAHKDVNYTGLEAMPEEFRQLWIDAGRSLVISA